MPGVFSSLRGATHLYTSAEPYHSVVYYSAEPAATAAGAGLTGWAPYLLYRCAPLVPVSGATVAALVWGLDSAGVINAWRQLADRFDGKQAVAFVLDGVDRALRRILARHVGGPLVRRAAELAATAVAACDNRGRPLAAAWAAVDAPAEPHVRLWLAVTALREHRGAGHFAVLMNKGIDADEAHVLAALTERLDPRAAHRDKNKSELQWDAAYHRLADRGWVDGAGELTERGAHAWQRVIRDTDALDQAPQEALGPDGCVSLHRALIALSERVVAAGEFPWPNPQALQWRFAPRRDHR